MQQVRVTDLAALLASLDAGTRPVLLDVREPWEFELASIEGSELIPISQLEARFTELDPDAETVVICHHGNRSRAAAEHFIKEGFTNVYNLAGGPAFVKGLMTGLDVAPVVIILIMMGILLVLGTAFVAAGSAFF